MTASKSTGYSTFKGVFIPTIVTILGAILYLRHGWLVGNGGFIGAVIIVLLCKLITVSTALSLSSIASNARLHAGGAYAIISQSLGKETGGAIGLMLYLAQSMAIVLVIFGFREGWLSIFPNHHAFLIDILCYASLITIVIWNTKLAFRLQTVVFVVTILAVISVSFAPFTSTKEINWVGSFPSFQSGYRGFWQVFAVFFPAVTGILAGSSLSGELKDPRRSIPKGTLSAVSVSGLIYLWLAYVFATSADQTDLLNNYNMMAEISIFPPLITFAVLGACFCAGLATLVGAPRIMNALAKDGLLPYSEKLAKTNAKGEPQSALFFTSFLVFLGILLRDLNLIAPLITICFLATYGTVNLIVLIEQKLGLLSFRPSIKIPIWIPAIGAFSSLFAMLIINSSVALLAIIVILYGYVYFGRTLNEKRQDVRTNLFIAMARWAVRKSINTYSREGKVWMPYPLIPILNPEQLENLDLGEVITAPTGSLRVLSFEQGMEITHKEKIFYQQTCLHNISPEQGILISMETFQQDFFQPNILILGKQDQKYVNIEILLQASAQFGLGIVYQSHLAQDISSDTNINVWIRPGPPDWDLHQAQVAGNLDLILLLAIQLASQKNLTIQLITTLQSEEELPLAQNYLEGLADLGRLPKTTKALAFLGNLWDSINQTPSAQIHIFGLPEKAPFSFINRIEANTDGLRLFIRSSGKENLLA